MSKIKIYSPPRLEKIDSGKILRGFYLRKRMAKSQVQSKMQSSPKVQESVVRKPDSVIHLIEIKLPKICRLLI